MKDFNKTVRSDILKMIHRAKSGHPGGSLSCVEILSVLYQDVMFVPKEWKKSPDFNKRDRFILSKGHASAALYSVLANLGFFSCDELQTFRQLGSRLQGHPSTKTKLEGIEVSTGSLGQGLSMAVGVALALRLNANPAHVFCLLGDGEMQEGSVWEALMNANNQKLDNLTIIIDKNKLQIDGSTNDIKSLEPLDKKFEAFGWQVYRVDGHNEEELKDALIKCKNTKGITAVIADTIKGKGVSFMEDTTSWHGKAPNDNELELALEEINA